jgi:hypothetical protein
MHDILQLLIQRLNQMHAALGSLSQSELSEIKPVTERTKETMRTEFQFGCELVDLQNQASLVIESLGRLKDHFKKWLTANGKPVKISEDVINTKFSVALIHDLWNLEKHVELRDPPRSGKVPKLVIHGRGLVIGRGNALVSQVHFTLDTWTGDFTLGKHGDACVRLNAEVIDEHGMTIGDFEDLCIQASRIWESEMRNSGVKI